MWAGDLQDLLPGEQQRLDPVQESTCPDAGVLWGIIFQQHLSDFFHPISYSPCCSFIVGPPVQQAGPWWVLGGSSALWRSFQSLRPLGLLDGARLGLVAAGVTCPAAVCMLSPRAASAETALSPHLLHRPHLPPAKIPVRPVQPLGWGLGWVGALLFPSLTARLCFTMDFGWEIGAG